MLPVPVANPGSILRISTTVAGVGEGPSSHDATHSDDAEDSSPVVDFVVFFQHDEGQEGGSAKRIDTHGMPGGTRKVCGVCGQHMTLSSRSIALVSIRLVIVVCL